MERLTPYAVLGVKNTDSDDTIRRAYHVVARTEHPDASVGGKPTPAWYISTEAYTAIKSVLARIQWEAQLRIAAKVCIKCRGYGVSGSRVGGGSVGTCKGCNGTGRSDGAGVTTPPRRR